MYVRIVCFYTVGAQELLTVKTVVDFSALFLTKTATDLRSIVTLSNGQKTQQTVVQETGWQTIETIFFRNANLRLALGTAIQPLSLAG